jgi:hypothetical protein
MLKISLDGLARLDVDGSVGVDQEDRVPVPGKTLRAGTPVDFRLTSKDVNHGFAVFNAKHEFLFQAQVEPGKTQEYVYTFKKGGTYYVECWEYCGDGHAKMVEPSALELRDEWLITTKSTREENEMDPVRQGDVLIVPIDPADVPAATVKVARENGRVVLAHGEVTGHAHAIVEESAELVTAEGAAELYLLVHGTEPVDLLHEEHATIPLLPGAYRIVRQREYTPETPVLVAD